ncbi:MAG TPA: hypothetical protein VJT49_14890 [Amycolatopsis sp.]|uniref:Acb2/Tad1 domain-containing protein n=1 Tax=Amycolatopsis sp. TaxID=37632 RepID=UPI002B49F1F3|nr:hypothetical protein [Amycolatopsis sp.]HKS46365.1 hypothetical protein [Amycolatopsis sp.]
MAEQIDPQTPGVVQGYRTHTQDEIDLVNQVKAVESQVAQLWKEIQQRPGTDKRMAAIARTNIEDGFMWLVRSIFKPDTEFDR